MGGKATLLNIGICNGDLKCQRMVIPVSPNKNPFMQMSNLVTSICLKLKGGIILKVV